MVQVNVREAKTEFSRLLKLAEAGEEVVIARNGVPGRASWWPFRRRQGSGSLADGRASSPLTRASSTHCLRSL